MSTSIWIVERLVPAFFKKRELARLLRIVSTAFDSEVPQTSGLSYSGLLTLFAEFTAAQVDNAMKRGENLDSIRSRMYRGAFEIGDRLRRQWRITNRSRVMDMGRMMYKFLGIEFRGTPEGGIDITKCMFAGHYSPETCRIISSLDEGVMAGLSGGGTLVFSQRITEGFESCKAKLLTKENAREKGDRRGHRCWWCNGG